MKVIVVNNAPAFFIFTKHLKNFSRVLVFTLVLGIVGTTHAQSGNSDTLDTLYEGLLKDPDNLDLLYGFAQQAIYESNFEAAISALEGMLVVSRSQPRALFELGTLYQRLGANKVAESYFIRARALFTEEEGVPDYMEAYFIESEKENAKNVFSGLVLMGLRYQTNPLNSPEAFEIFSGGLRVPPDPTRMEESDNNLFIFSRLNHKYKISPGTNLKTSALIYATSHEEQEQLDYSAIELSSGPEILVASTGDRLKLRPNLLVRSSDLDNDDLESTWGAALEGTYSLSTQSSVRGNLQYRDRDFDANNGKERTVLRSGDEIRFGLSWNSEFKRGHIITLGTQIRDVDAEVGESSSLQLALSARYGIRFKNPLFDAAGKQSVSFFVIRRDVEYDGPDARIHPTIVREDDEWRFGVVSTLPVSSNFGLYIKLETLSRESNLENYESKNNLASIALRFTF